MSKSKTSTEAKFLMEMSRDLNDIVTARMDEVNAYHLGFVAGRKAGILEGAQREAALKRDHELEARSWAQDFEEISLELKRAKRYGRPRKRT